MGHLARMRRTLPTNNPFELNHLGFVTRPNLMVFAVCAINDIREISMDDAWRIHALSL